MNFDFSDDQKQIQAQARQFLSAESPLSRVRKTLDGEQHWDEPLWRQIAELGWTATVIPEDFGGLGLSYLELCVIAEEMGRSLAAVPFGASVYLASQTLLLAADNARQQQWLPQLASGEWIGTVAFNDAANLNDDNATISGSCTALQGMAATHLIAKVGATLYWIDLGESGVSRIPLESIDPTQPMARLTFDSVPAVALSADAQPVIACVHDKAAVLLAFEQVGGCEATLDMGKAYTSQRYAFGRQVASFQAIKHKFADMYVAMELARSNAWYGAWALSADAPELPLAAATARVSAIDAYYECAKENLQAHGGMGFTWEFDCHLYYRRAQALALLTGGRMHWQEKLVDALLSKQPDAA